MYEQTCSVSGQWSMRWPPEGTPSRGIPRQLSLIAYLNRAHPCARTSAPTCTGVGEHARVRPCTAAKKEGGSFVRGTEESDRAAPLAPAEVEIREGAVLRGSGGPEHQAASAVPQPTDTAGSASHHLAQSREEQVDEDILAAKKPFCWRTFSTPTPVFVNYEKSI